MKLKKLRLRGFRGVWKGVGKEEIELDLDDLSGIVVLSGVNGSGKTTVLESLQPFRTMPSRGIGLKDACYLKDSSKELIFDHGGAEYRCLVTINANTGSSAGMMWMDGRSLTTGKVKEYDEVLRELFGSPKLFFNSVFCPQNAESLLALAPSVRKSFFAEFLGLGRLQEYADTAKEVGRSVSMYLNIRKADLDEAEKDLSDPVKLREGITDLEDGKKDLLTEIETGKTAVSDLSVYVKHHESEFAKQDEFKRQVAALNEEKRHRRAHHQDVVSRMKVTLDSVGAEIESLFTRTQGLMADSCTPTRAEDLRSVISRTEKELADLHEADKKCVEFESVRRELKSIREQLQHHRHRMDLRPPESADSEVCQKCDLLLQVKGRAEFLELNKRERELGVLGAEIKPPYVVFKDKMQIRKEIRDCTVQLDEIRLQMSRVHDQEKVAIELKNTEEMTEKALIRQRKQEQDMDSEQNVFEAQMRQVSDSLDELTDRLRPEVESQLEDARNEMDAAENQVREMEHAVVRLDADIEIRTALLKKSVEDLQKIAELKKIVRKKEQSAFEWSFLQDICGRNKLQALELDAAAPAISDLSNLLLSKCFGGRFQMYFRTQDDEGREVFDVVVHDAFGDTVEEMDLTMTSGGQQVLLLHALRLAMTLYAKAKSGKDFRTIFVDEIDGQLHSSVRHEFAEMNRQALREGDFETMVLVSHSNEVIDSADRIIEFKTDGVTVI